MLHIGNQVAISLLLKLYQQLLRSGLWFGRTCNHCPWSISSWSRGLRKNTIFYLFFPSNQNNLFMFVLVFSCNRTRFAGILLFLMANLLCEFVILILAMLSALYILCAIYFYLIFAIQIRRFEAVEARFLRASFSSFIDLVVLATKLIEEFSPQN